MPALCHVAQVNVLAKIAQFSDIEALQRLTKRVEHFDAHIAAITSARLSVKMPAVGLGLMTND